MKSHRYWRALPLLVLLLAASSAVIADYIGPRRESESERDPSGDYIELQKVSGPGGVQSCRLDTHCSTNPSPEQQEYWCNSGTLYPDGWCGAHPGSCWSGTVVTRYCHTIPGDSDPEATVSSTFSCATPGSNGWCRGGPLVNFSAREPVTGKVITYIEGNPGMLCDPADAPTVTCSWAPPDGASTLEFWAHTTYGDTSPKGSRALQVDTVAPSASLSVPLPGGQNGWHITPVQASPAGSDATSGIQQLLWQIDGQAWRSDFPLTLGEGIHAIAVQATDRAGNSNGTTATVRVDMTPPILSETILGQMGPEGWYNQPVELTVTGTDQTSGLASALIRIDGGTWQPGPLTLADDGVHEVQFQTTDVAGNSTLRTHEISIDRQGPALALDTEGTPGDAEWFLSETIQVTARAIDLLSGVKHVALRLDGGEWLDADQASVSGDGRHTVEIRAEDLAGNSSASTYMLLIDSTPPRLTAAFNGTAGLSGWYVSPVNAQFSASDSTSGVAELAAQVDGAGWQEVDQIHLDADGLYSVEFRARDQAGNLSTDSLQIAIDQTAPEGEITAPLPEAVLKLTVEVNGWATDALSGLSQVEISSDGGLNWLPARLSETGRWMYAWNTLRTKGGKQNLQVRFSDRAGNTMLSELPVTVANRGPDITLQPRWFIWESGSLLVEAGDLPVGVVRITIRDPLDRWAALENSYGMNTYPREVHWDRRFATAGGGSVLAPAGEYQVEVVAIDEVGQSARAEGVIVVPNVPTPTPTMTPTRKPTSTLIPTPSAQPTMTPPPPTPTVIVMPTPRPTPTPPSYTRAVPLGLWLAILSSLGFLLMVAISAATDPRPPEIQRLSKQISRIPHPTEYDEF